MHRRRLLTLALSVSSAFAAEQWIKLDPTGKPPPGWANATAVYDTANNRMIVFGGSTASGFTNRVWVLANANGLGGTPEWAELKPVGGPPPPRVNHMAAYDQADNRLIVYGGSTTGLAVLTDLWVLTNANGLGGTPQWSQLSYSGDFPPLRVYIKPCYDPLNNRMILFGGCDSPCFTPYYVNEVWILSNANGLAGTPQFTQLFPAGGPPAPRGGYAVGYDSRSNRLVIFGGGGHIPKFNDTWALTGANGLGAAPRWVRLAAVVPPPEGYGMSSVYDSASNQLFIVGGVLGGVVTNSAWRLDNANGLGASRWVKLSPIGEPPPGWDSIGYVSAFDPVNQRMMIFGGHTPTGIHRNDVWVLVLGSPADTTPPVITPRISPAPNAAGWNNSAVTVTWDVSDPESGVASTTGCPETILSAPTAGTTLTCSATNAAGLSTSRSVTIKIDKIGRDVSPR